MNVNQLTIQFTEQVQIELVDLTLHSVAPITVTGPNGTFDAWTLSLDNPGLPGMNDPLGRPASCESS